MTEEEELIPEPLVEAIADHREHLQRVVIGARVGFVGEHGLEPLREALAGLGLGDRLTIGTIGEAAKAIDADLGKVYSES